MNPMMEYQGRVAAEWLRTEEERREREREEEAAEGFATVRAAIKREEKAERGGPADKP